MFYKMGNIILVCIFAWTVFSGVNSGKLIKRNDIDLQTCIDNFNVHKDKIIRTQDSRDMGAKYLNEIDLGSREECLRLCCETEFCDVFVYEEKTPGSCYLFQCGPPEDFKCKFTQHANYSSAVLSINRGINELENQIKLTKHEQDLTRLRKTNTQNVRPTEKITQGGPQIVTTTTQKSREVLPIAPTKSPAGRRCNPYQFECRTSNECIAIYNACDGIPQCSDGSDEAPELGCPESGTTIRPQILPQKNPALLPNNAFMQGAQLRKPLPHLIPDSYVSNVGNSRQASETHDSDFVRPPDTRNQIQNFAEVPSQAFLPPRPILQQNNQWLPQNPQQYPEKNSHIFQHKENGLQVLSDSGGGSGGNIQNLGVNGAGQRASDSAGGLQYGDINMRNEYKVPNYYNDMYRQQYPAENWQANSQSRVDNNAYVPDWPAQFPPQQSNTNDQPPAYHSEAENLPSWKAELLNKNAESKTYDHTTIHEPKDLPDKKEHQAVQEIKAVATETKKHEKHVHKTKAEHLKQKLDDDLQDGESERPGGAILSLTLGVTLTCVMAILVGCRLRMVKRRMLRRGGKSPYAHDADYLVNGMYL